MQAIYRRIHHEHLDWSYRHVRTVRRILRELLYLPYLPAEEIHAVFEDIKDDVLGWPDEWYVLPIHYLESGLTGYILKCMSYS